MTNKALRTIVQFPCSLFVVKSLKDLFLMFRFFLNNKLISTNQSSFSINQLLSTTREIYKSFDDGLEVRSVFLDISKAFDKVWHEGVIFKLKQNGISGDLLNILVDFLSNRKQKSCS